MSDNKTRLALRVGGLLYTPAINAGIVKKIEEGAFPGLTSIAFCLEDSIMDEALEQAETTLKNTLAEIRDLGMPGDRLPLIFARVRSPHHLEHMAELLSEELGVLTGFIFPKFDLSNGREYIDIMSHLNRDRRKPIYFMPILESAMIANISTRSDSLVKIKYLTDEVSDIVLNIRVGGNDFCNLYGLRRGINQNIYQIGVVRDALVDIINIFASGYIVSGPVWEYFGSAEGEWADGLRRELELDRLNGFIGKTAVHPSQLPIIFESMKVSAGDYDDAKKILKWQRNDYGVEKSSDGSRMNEVKCHLKWAQRIVDLENIYGIRGH